MFELLFELAIFVLFLFSSNIFGGSRLNRTVSHSTTFSQNLLGLHEVTEFPGPPTDSSDTIAFSTAPTPLIVPSLITGIICVTFVNTLKSSVGGADFVSTQSKLAV